MSKNTINFGIVGTSQMAATMISAFKHCPEANVIAVCSQSAERANSFAHFFNISNAYGSLEDLLANHQIDAVYIANATENHAQSTIAALKAGKAVLCEKPIAISELESKEIIAEAQSAGKLCMEAMWTLFLPSYERLFKAYQSNEVGKPAHLYADFGYPVSEAHQPKAYLAGPGAGVLLDRGVYPIALALKIFGPVNDVSGKVLIEKNGVDTHASLNLSHSNGGQSQIAVSMQVLLQNKAILSCNGGAISLEPPLLGAEIVMLTQSHSTPSNSEFGANSTKQNLKQLMRKSPFLRRLHKSKKAGVTEFHSYGANQYLPMLNHFCALYQSDQKASDVVPLSLSSQVLNIIDSAKRLK